VLVNIFVKNTPSPYLDKSNLKILAALVWYSGVIALSIKSFMLLQLALKLNPEPDNICLAIFSALVIGLIKTHYLFNGLCIKNLKRIDSLKHPKFWQFYRPQFFIFLLSMIILGHYLSSAAKEHYSMLIGLAVIEISIATALLFSGHHYWQKKNDNKYQH